jgi:hypothetical protein
MDDFTGPSFQEGSGSGFSAAESRAAAIQKQIRTDTKQRRRFFLPGTATLHLHIFEKELSSTVALKFLIIRR